jgi:molybdenum-dependent DNA-binding transcriptional regulator ModE
MRKRDSTKRERALLALLTHGSVREAGRFAGISEATLYRYLAERDFSEELAREKRGVMEAGLAQLQQAQSQAVETLIRNLHCESPAVEVRTAQIILEHAQKAYETGEVSRRLDALEEALKD